MVVLHLVLLLRRLKAGGLALPPSGQALFDRFCRDIDDNFREMGVSDLGVPRQMRRVGEMFYGRARAYETALEANDRAGLEVALARNVYGGPAMPVGAARLAAYIEKSAVRLAKAPTEAIERAEFEFPSPEEVPAPAAL
jgi:cytochrome b pre-mRNA-processing protein 3